MEGKENGPVREDVVLKEGNGHTGDCILGSEWKERVEEYLTR